MSPVAGVMYRGQGMRAWRVMGRILMVDRFLRLVLRLMGGRL
jgi:hypothetical protein